MRRVDHDQGARSAGSSVGGLTLAPRLVVITDGLMPAVDHEWKRVWPVATAKRDRDEVFVEFTKSVCPVCKVVVDAQVNIREDKVYLRKRCREHDQFEALVYGDAQAYLSSARFNKPGTIPLAFQTEVRDGCPSDCGLCPEHKQHACLGIIEVNTNCNLDCPICFADSGHQPDGYSITLEQCERMLDVFVESEGEPEVVMFSGGEPTIHKHILEFIDAAQARPIKVVNLNTNGIRLATDKRFVAALAQRNRPGRPVNIYLQFDGFDERTHREIRGKDLRERKQQALDNCAEVGLTVTLVAAIERGLNEHEVGDIVRFGIDHPAVRSVGVPAGHALGAARGVRPVDRLTNSDVIELIAGQCPDWFGKDDFFPGAVVFPDLPVDLLLVGGPQGGPHRRGADPQTDQPGRVPGLRDQPGHARSSGARGVGEAGERLAVHGRRDHRPQPGDHRCRIGVRRVRDRPAPGDQ
jgi:uncharacterized radical SAM superfamily Fe-S cluster-containing enzyme